jgi:hypothetical protein
MGHRASNRSKKAALERFKYMCCHKGVSCGRFRTFRILYLLFLVINNVFHQKTQKAVSEGTLLSKFSVSVRRRAGRGRQVP